MTRFLTAVALAAASLLVTIAPTYAADQEEGFVPVGNEKHYLVKETRRVIQIFNSGLCYTTVIVVQMDDRMTGMVGFLSRNSVSLPEGKEILTSAAWDPVDESKAIKIICKGGDLMAKSPFPETDPPI